MDTITDTVIARALSVLSRPQHPDHVAQATALFVAHTTLDELWDGFLASKAVGEVWGIAALAWHIAHGAQSKVAEALADHPDTIVIGGRGCGPVVLTTL